MLSAWDDFRLSADEHREVDDKQVLVLGHMIGRGKRSQVDPAQLGGKTYVPEMKAKYIEE